MPSFPSKVQQGAPPLKQTSQALTGERCAGPHLSSLLIISTTQRTLDGGVHPWLRWIAFGPQHQLTKERELQPLLHLNVEQQRPCWAHPRPNQRQLTRQPR